MEKSQLIHVLAFRISDTLLSFFSMEKYEHFANRIETVKCRIVQCSRAI